MIQISEITQGPENLLKERVIKHLSLLGYNSIRFERAFDEIQDFDDRLDLCVNCLQQTGIYY